MKALFGRLWALIGRPFFFVYIGILALAASFELSPSGASFSSPLRNLLHAVVGVVIVALLVSIRAAIQYVPSSATQAHEDVLPPLLQSQQEYCLALRSFGEDGGVVVPRTAKRGQIPRAAGMIPNLTMEQVVATTVRESLSLPTYAIVDQTIMLAPPGLTFIRASNTDWREVVLRLIRRAHSIVLILGPESELRAGFAWEIEQIVSSGVTARIVLALPPPDQDEFAHQRALHNACMVLAMLTGSGNLSDQDSFRVLEYELMLDPRTVVVHTTETSEVRWWALAGGSRTGKNRTPAMFRKKIIADSSVYSSSISEALKAADRQLAGLSFASRYPLR